MTTEGLGRPNGAGMPPAALTCAADKKAGCCKAMNCAAIGFMPPGPPGGPNPLPNGFLSNLGSEKKERKIGSFQFKIFCKMFCHVHM